MSDNGHGYLDRLPERAEPIELVPATSDGEVWERLRGESRQAFANFAHFRNIGMDRSLAKAAEDLGKSPYTLRKQSAKYRWQERVEAYDDAFDRKMREEIESERMQVNREGAALFRRLQVLAGQRMIGDNSDPRNIVVPLDANDLDARDVAAILETAWRGLRAATGQPTDYVAGKFGISAEDLLRIVQGLYDIAERLVDPERRGRLALEFQSFIESGGRQAA